MLSLIISLTILAPVFLFETAVSTTAAPSTVTTPDIDVTYIERTPRYYRYCVEYSNNVPTLCAGTETQKRWPAAGESVTYTAHVMNKGNATIPSGYTYQWLVNGTVVKTGTAGSTLGSGQEMTFQYQTTFPSSAQTIQFKADTNNNVSEFTENNNSLSIGSHDLTIKIWIEKGEYDIFNNTLNRVNTYSFEDWIQDHFSIMNKRFTQAVYPATTQGILDRVRIDKIVVADELSGSGSPMNNDPEQNLIDGRWQFMDGEESWQHYVDRAITTTDFGLIHELAHQLGVIDLYDMNIDNDPANNNGFHVKDASGNDIPASQLPTYAWDQILFQYPGIMGGGDTQPYKDTSYFESHSAAGMNSAKGYRRGYYGEYLFDTPTNTSLKLTDNYGNVLANYSVALYQKDADNKQFDNTPEITGTTDGQGIIALPNRTVTGVTTATGHTLKANPFGQIRVTGMNGTFFVKVTKNGTDNYGWFLIHDLNLAYWNGNKTSATITVKTNADARTLDTTNLALRKPATSNRGSNPGHEPSKAVDGDKTTIGNSWMVDNYPYTVNSGDWWQVDLGSQVNLAEIVIYPDAQNYSNWCDNFQGDISATGAFNGEQKMFLKVTGAPHTQNIPYIFPAAAGRYVRLTCNTSQNWIQLQEFEAYALNTPGTLIVPYVKGPNGATTPNNYSGQVSININGYGQASQTQYSDAFYIFSDNSGNPITPQHLSDFGLCINNQPVDRYTIVPAYNSSHNYQFNINLSSSGPITFGVCDTAMGDNSGSYFVTVTQQGSVPTPTPTRAATPTPTPVTQSVSAWPSDDSYVRSDVSGGNYGGSTVLNVLGSPAKITYLKYDLTGLAGKKLLTAKLHIRTAGDATGGTQNVKGVSNTTWTESTLTYNNRPALGSVIRTFVPSAINTWYDVDVMSYINGKFGQKVTVAIDSSSNDGVSYSSKETTYKPVLNMTYQ